MGMRFATILMAAVSTITPAAGATLAVNFDNTTGEPLSNPPMTLGWSFNVNTALNVTSLSFFDSGQDGLAESHAIGIWTSTGVLMASATVSAGTTDPLHDKFRAVAITPTLLNPGSYLIGALFATGNDAAMFPTFTQGFSTASEITFGRTASVVGPTLTSPAPTFFTMGPGYFGPNFEFQSVPEPSSMFLVGAGLVLAGLRFRPRRS